MRSYASVEHDMIVVMATLHCAHTLPVSRPRRWLFLDGRAAQT